MPVNILITFIIGSALGWIFIKVTVAPQHLKGLILGCCAAGMYVCLFYLNGLMYRIYIYVCVCVCTCERMYMRMLCSTIYPVKHSCITLDTRNSVRHLLLLFFQQNQNVHVSGFCNRKPGQPLIIVPTICREKSSPFGPPDVCHEHGIAYSSLFMMV